MTRDQAARDAARLELGANVVVEAGAGTGKTTILTDRILFLLLCGDVPPERLVALTFTEKAASEIKARVAAKLTDLVAAIDGAALAEPRAQACARFQAEALARFARPSSELRARADQAIQNLDRAVIGTIHHFAATILRLYPVEAGIDPAFEIDQGEGFDELFEAEWALWLDVELGEVPRRKKDWLETLALAGLSDLEALARELCREGVRQGGLGATRALKDDLRRLIAEHAALLKHPDPGRGKTLETIRGVSAHLSAVLAALEGDAPVSAALELPDFGASRWPKAWQELPGAEIFESARRLAESVAPGTEALVRRAERLLLPFADAFRAQYVRRGLVDYDGLLSAARNLVRGDLAVRARLKARYDVFLIDEFQDTDPLQGELLLFLAEGRDGAARRWEEIRFGPGRVFIVGDPKQSIYRFRGADIRAYERFTRALIAQGALKCDLQTNFRGHEGLTAPVNSVFEAVMAEEAGLQPAYLPIFPGRTREKPEAAVELVFVEGQEAAKAERQRAEARWIAAWIRIALRERRHSLKDVAILLRSVSPLPYYLDALKESSIPYIVESDRYFYSTQETVDFVNLLRVLDDPGDRLSLAGLLRSPLCGLSDRDLCALANRRGFSYLEERPDGVLGAVERGKVGALFSVLRSLRAHAGREPLAAFIERVLRDTFIVELCAAAYAGEQTASNLMKFGRLAAQAGRARAMTLKEFIAKVCALMDRSAEEGESPLADEQLDAVRIMTIHKSKGLEFPVVILPNLSAAARAGGEKPVAAVDWSHQTAGLRLPGAKAADAAMALIEENERKREERERVRLLYVAMTRAKERLIMLGDAGGASSASLAGLLARAGAWPDKENRPEKIILGEVDIPAIYIKASDRSGEKFARASPAAGKMSVKKIAELWRGRRQAYEELSARAVFITPTGILRGETEAAKTFLPMDEEKTIDAPLLGRLCHRALELWDFSARTPVLAAVEQAARGFRRERPMAPWSDLIKEAEEIVASFLASSAGRELARSEILGREIPFVCPLKGQVLRGSMDVLYREGGHLWIGDYKTERLKSGEAAERAKRYREQGRAYIEAARLALGETPGFKVIFLRSGEIVEAV